MFLLPPGSSGPSSSMTPHGHPALVRAVIQVPQQAQPNPRLPSMRLDLLLRQRTLQLNAMTCHSGECPTMPCTVRLATVAPGVAPVHLCTTAHPHPDRDPKPDPEPKPEPTRDSSPGTGTDTGTGSGDAVQDSGGDQGSWSGSGSGRGGSGSGSGAGAESGADSCAGSCLRVCGGAGSPSSVTSSATGRARGMATAAPGLEATPPCAPRRLDHTNLLVSATRPSARLWACSAPSRRSGIQRGDGPAAKQRGGNKTNFGTEGLFRFYIFPLSF